MSFLDVTAMTPLLKQFYGDSKVEDLTFPDNPTFALLKKLENFGGELYKKPLIYGNPQRASADFATAQANPSSTVSKAFEIPFVDYYSLATVQGNVIRRSMDKAAAFMKAMTLEVDGAMKTAGHRQGIHVFGSGWGTIGQIASGSATVTVTLTRASDAYRFEEGAEIVFYQTEDSGTLSGAALTVVGVDVIEGTVTFNAAPTSVSAADDYYMAFKGDRENASSPTKQVVTGFDGWIPASAPTSDLFFNVNRTSNPTRLGGLRIDGSQGTLEEVLLDAVSLVRQNGGSSDLIVMNDTNANSLVKQMTSKQQIVQVKAAAQVGFPAVQVFARGGSLINIVSDRYCPDDVIWVLDTKSWEFASAGGKAIQILDVDGQSCRALYNADAYETRVGGSMLLACRAPGFNARINL